MNKEALIDSLSRFFESSSRSRSVLRAGAVTIGGVMMIKGLPALGGVFIGLGIGGTVIDAAIGAAIDTRNARRDSPINPSRNNF